MMNKNYLYPELGKSYVSNAHENNDDSELAMISSSECA